jgi:hypothetical protein
VYKNDYNIIITKKLIFLCNTIINNKDYNNQIIQMNLIMNQIEQNAIMAIDFVQENILTISLTINFIFMFTYLFYKLLGIESKPNIYEILDELTDNEVEKVIIHLSNRVIIPAYFTKQKIQQIVLSDNTITFMNYDELWKYLIDNNDVLTDDYNYIMEDLIQNITNNYNVTDEDISDISDDISDETNEIPDEKQDEKKDNTLESALQTLPYSILQEYAGINNKSKTKTQLVEIIINNFYLIKTKMEERKLKILNKQLSY